MKIVWICLRTRKLKTNLSSGNYRQSLLVFYVTEDTFIFSVYTGFPKGRRKKKYIYIYIISRVKCHISRIIGYPLQLLSFSQHYFCYFNNIPRRAYIKCRYFPITKLPNYPQATGYTTLHNYSIRTFTR